MAGGGKGLATVLAVVVVLSMVAPTTVAAGTPDRSVRAATGVDADQARANPGDAPGGVAQIAGNGSSPVGEDALPVVRKLAAIRAVRNISTNGNGGLANHVSRAESRFNGTLSAYSDARRLRESGAFTDDAVGIRALAHFNGTNQSERAKRAADLVFEADNESARTAVADARRVLDRFGDAMGNPGQRRSARAHLRTAERALDRAERARSRSTDGRKYWGARAQALTQLRTAHRHAHMVMRFVDREAGAQVTIASTEDPVRNGSDRTQYVVSGTVTAPRPSTLGNVTVSVNDGSAVTAQTAARSVAPGENLSFAAPVNLTDRVNEIEVRVAGDDGGNAQGNGPPSDGAGQHASATLRLDGDGLAEDVETSTLGTDPIDPDSDASATAADEADDGVIDGREDYDGDNVTTLRELELGTDPLAADTDGDGLEDGEELIFTGTDPLAADTDGDGTDDGAEDPDGDGLTNVEEVEAGTFHDVADSDGDGLDDAADLDRGTDPLAFDTDDDGLQDGDELREAFGTDPLDEDTDDDGVLDGNETYTTAVENETLGATVALTGQGNVAAGTTIQPPENARFTGGRAPSSVAASEFVDVDVESEIESATVTLAYDSSSVQTNESSLAVYRINESSGVYERLPSEVHPANDTVSATTDHFSPVVVIDPGAAIGAIRPRNRPASAGPGGTVETVAFDFETTSPVPIASGSSATVDGNTWRCRNDPYSPPTKDTPISGECAIRDGKAIVREETNRQRYLEHTLTLPDVDPDEALFVNASVTAHIESMWSNSALRLVVENQRGETLDVFRLKRDFTTGDVTETANPRVNITQYAGETVTISLRANGRWTYTYQDTWASIEAEYLTIERRRGGSTDTDGDGISDAQERAGVPLAGTLATVTLDPTDPDTDGDGREDGEEVDVDDFRADQDVGDDNVIAFPGYAWASDPTSADTDGDGLDDESERRGWTIPVVNETGAENPVRYDGNSGQGIRPGRASQPGEDTIVVTSDPFDPDSDGDGLTDAEEIEGTHTDPRRVQTYSITGEHEDTLKNVFGDRISGSEADTIRKMGLLRNDLDFEVTNPDLTDATDDFDLAIDDSAAGLDQFDVLSLDGSDRTDYWLSNEHEITQYSFSPIGRSPAYLYERTDPWVSDTDGDGLTDGQEYNGLGVIASGSRYVYTTDPTLRDTDSDRLEDLAELRFGSDPRAKNIDGDQFSDFTDPAPYTENIPPTPHASFKQGAFNGERVTVGASDESGVEEVRVIYEYETAAGGTEDAIYVFHPDGATEFEARASPPAGVANLTIQASDQRGNAYGITIRVGDDGTGKALGSDIVLAAGGVFGSTATNPLDELAVGAGMGASVGTVAIVAVGVTIVAGGVLGVKQVYDAWTAEETTKTYEAPLFATPAVASYRGGAVHLREGFVRTSGEFTRGYGWAYIQTTSSVTQAEIEHVLNNGREVTQGEVTFVIGEGLSGEEKIILTIIGGTLMAAASSSTVEDPCNDIVNVEKNGDHATRDGKPVDDTSTLRQLIKDEVVKIIDVAGKRYYIAKFRGEFVLISAKGGPGYWIVSTILTSDAINNLFKTIEDATDQINGNKETVYDPENGIDC